MRDRLGGAARLAVLVGLGVVAALGQAPHDLWPATVIALAALLVLHARTDGALRATLQVWAFGLGYFGFALRWIVEPFLVDAARYGWMAPFALGLMALGAALFWAVAGWVAVRIAPRSQIALALLLVAAEMTRSLVFTGFPWALLGHIWVPTWLAQAAALGGPHLLSVLTLVAALALARLWARDLARGAAVLMVLALLALTLRASPPPPVAADAPTVRLVQPNARQDLKWDPAFAQMFRDRLVDLTQAGARPDLVVWPETAIPSLLEYAVDDLPLLDAAARGAPLVFGIQRRDAAGLFYNALVLLDGGAISAIYDKQHLVPFGEYVPFGDLLGQWGIRGLAARDGAGFAAGQTAGVMDIPGIGAAVPLICYEGIFAEEITFGAVRPRLLLLITNDAWFGQAAGPYQHLAQARLRAIEQGLPMVRVANTGISAMIDAQGRITASLPLGAAGAFDAVLPPVTAAVPLYTRTGDAPVAVLLVLALAALVRRRRR